MYLRLRQRLIIAGIKSDGTPYKKKKSWFGYRLHLISDATHELPIAYEITPASTGEQPVMRGMFEKLADKHSKLIEDCQYAMGDRGYDSTELLTLLWDQYKIKPVIDIRNMRKSQETSLLRTVNINNVAYDYKGTVFCHCPDTGDVKKMAHGGFEKDRNTLRYLCPARHYGIECKGKDRCPAWTGIRIPLKEDRRVFTPVARSSHAWKKLYNKRTSVERINSRVAISYGFDKHYIRGQAKMKMRCSLSMCVMLAVALGRARQQDLDKIRSLCA